MECDLALPMVSGAVFPGEMFQVKVDPINAQCDDMLNRRVAVASSHHHLRQSDSAGAQETGPGCTADDVDPCGITSLHDVLIDRIDQNTGSTGAFLPLSMETRRENAARVKVAISVALIPRTIIAHSFDDIIVILQPDNISGRLSVACVNLWHQFTRCFHFDLLTKG